MLSAGGFDGVRALLAESGAAPTVGQYAAFCITDSAPRIDFLLRCLGLHGDLEQKADACTLGFLWSVESNARQALLRAVAGKVDADQRVRLFKSSPFHNVTWLAVEEYGTEISTRYWKDVFPQWSRRQSDSELNELVDRLLDADRPRAAFHAAHMDWARLETSRLKRLLTDVATVGKEPQGTFRLDAHDISEALDALDGRAGVTVNDMAQMEFRFVSALDHSKHGIPNLERQIAESPLLYMQVMALLWKRSDDGEDPPEWRIDDPERRGSVASAMHRLIHQMERIPGTSADGKIVGNDLTDWLTQVRNLASQYARADMTDHSLGQLLAKAPSEGTGVWPCAPVCEAMERIASPEIAEGFLIGVHNSRGAHWRDEGGAQERELAAKYRGWSQKLAFEYPYVAGVLEQIAVSYDREAEWHDSEAKVSKRLRH